MANSSGWLDKKQILPILFTIVAVFVAYYLQAPYLMKIEPDIRIYPDTMKDIPVFRYQHMLDDNYPKGLSLNFCVQNLGQADTGPVSAAYKGEIFNRRVWKFPGVESKETKCFNGYLKFMCQVDNNCDTNPPEVEIGPNLLELEMYCRDCPRGRRTWKEYIKICIWDQSISICQEPPLRTLSIIDHTE